MQKLQKLPGKKGENDSLKKLRKKRKKKISSNHSITENSSQKAKSVAVNAALRRAQDGVVESVGIFDDRGFKPPTICGSSFTWNVWTAHRSSQRSWWSLTSSLKCPCWTYGMNFVLENLGLFEMPVEFCNWCLFYIAVLVLMDEYFWWLFLDRQMLYFEV